MKLKNNSSKTRKAFTFTELVIVVTMVSLFVLLAVNNLFGLLAESTFRAQVRDLISTFQMAANAAAESDRRYEIIIDPVEQTYLLRQITTPDFANILDEEVIVQNEFNQNCQIALIEFDDGKFTNQDKAKFRVGRSGFQYGGRIVLLDSNQKEYSVIINRLNRIIDLKEGNARLLTPKAQDDVMF